MRIPKKAFILAAGYGRRMRPLTDEVPKPLVRVGGMSLLDHILHHLKEAGVEEIVVNAHHKAGQIKEWADKAKFSANIHVVHEEELLETGGGVKNAVHYFKDEPFYVIAGDAYWEGDALLQLAQGWDADKMDILMVLQDIKTMNLTRGVGDYDLKEDGRAVRSLNKSGAYMFTNIRINHPRIFKNAPAGAFSFLDLMDRAEAAGRLYGLKHEGAWHHISTPEDLKRVNAAKGGG